MVKEIQTLADAADWLERRGTKPEEIQWVDGIRKRVIDFVRRQQAQKPEFRDGDHRHDARGEKTGQTASKSESVPQTSAGGWR